MKQYYFLANVLPPVEIGEEPDLSFVDVCRMLELNLAKNDLEQVAVVRRYYDLQNLRLLWQQAKLDPRGNLSEAEMEEALLMEQMLPEYVFEYMKLYEGEQERYRYFAKLITAYFQEEANKASGFLREYLEFEREWRLVLTGFRAKEQQRSIAAELQFEDPNDRIVAQLLAQKDAKNYEPPYGYEDLKPLFEEHSSSPIELHKALCHYRFKRVGEMTMGEPFSLDYILGYIVQLIIAEKWIELDEQKGEEIVEKIVEEVS